MPPKASGRDVELRQLMDTLMKIEAEVGKVGKTKKKRGGGKKENVEKFTVAKQNFMKKLGDACDVMEREVGASDPKAVITRNQAIRAKLRELELGWEEMNTIYLHEHDKRKSKLSVEEMNAQRQLLVDLKEEINALKDINEEQVSGQSRNNGMFYKDVQTINSSQLAGEETGASYNSQSYSPKPPTQAGAMSDRQALRVHQIRERGKQMDEKYLTEIEQGVERLGELAKNVHEEIEMQDRMLDHLHDKLDMAHDQVGNVNTRMKDTLKKVRAADKFLVDIMCVLLLLGLLGILYAVCK